MENLIANTGVQFYNTEVEFNPSEPLKMSSGKTLKYAFAEIKDILTETITFDMLYPNVEGGFIPFKEIRGLGKFELQPDGNELLDEAGMPKMQADVPTSLFGVIGEDSDALMSINSLGNYFVKSPIDGTRVPAFDLILNRWLPMPMYEKGMDGISLSQPTGWCRVKIIPTGEGKGKGMKRYRMVWAIDTTLGDPLSVLRPSFYDGETGSKSYSLCNKADLIVDFCFQDGSSMTPYSIYVSSLLGLDIEKMIQRGDSAIFKFAAWYIYLVNFIRLSGCAPEVTLFHKAAQDIPVDMVLDIGNSRTCGVLFEEGDTKRACMLEIRDMSQPWVLYSDPFDMRLVFRKADLGNEIVLDEDMFQWQSAVRIGNEARDLMYRCKENTGLSAKTTNYSSPKRYLWDNEAFDGQWMFQTTLDDPFSIRTEENVFVKGLTEYFAADGQYKPGELNDLSNHYSRASLMTFVMVEIFQHALMQINSMRYREPIHGRGNVDCRRVLRNVIVTCPTAMPRLEQIQLRKSAIDAWDVLMRGNSSLQKINIVPSPLGLSITDDYDERKQWSFDEASCAQLVYLYAELTQRYDGEVGRFLEVKGHVRPEFVADGYDKKSLTIGSVDIGAGTTDLMICSYQQTGHGKLVPVPKFWDSFYQAGDDIVHNIVQNVILDGPKLGSTTEGSVASVCLARLMAMNDEALRQLPVYQDPDQPIYHKMIDDIAMSLSQEQREELIRDLANNMVRGMFGKDASFLSDRDRRCRVDWNTQVSVPMALFFMDLLSKDRSQRKYSFSEIFSHVTPAQYLLDFFEFHFGFRFEEIVWTYDPEVLNKEIRNTMESLVKQLSIVLNAYHCDIVVLSGRPTAITALPELFVKHYPISPDRLVRLNKYRVGSWYPFSNPDGDFRDHKSVVAVGAMVGYLASTQGFNGLVLDLKEMIRQMKPTTAYMGPYKSARQRVEPTMLSPQSSTTTMTLSVFPAFIGCRQLDSKAYQARPIYAIYNNSRHNTLCITLSRSYMDDRERLYIEEVTDEDGNNVPKSQVVLRQQSIVDDGKYWLDKGEFILSLN